MNREPTPLRRLLKAQKLLELSIQRRIEALRANEKICHSEIERCNHVLGDPVLATSAVSRSVGKRLTILVKKLDDTRAMLTIAQGKANVEAQRGEKIALWLLEASTRVNNQEIDAIIEESVARQIRTSPR